jgi:hypothetical protein
VSGRLSGVGACLSEPVGAGSISTCGGRGGTKGGKEGGWGGVLLLPLFALSAGPCTSPPPAHPATPLLACLPGCLNAHPPTRPPTHPSIQQLKQQQASVCGLGEWPPLRCRRLSVRTCWGWQHFSMRGQGGHKGREGGREGRGAAASLVCPLCRSLHKPSTCPPSHPSSTWLFGPPTHPPAHPYTLPAVEAASLNAILAVI